MNERLNKTSICSIVFLDIAEYSQKPVSEQIECKDRFNRLINDAIKDIAQNDRIILDTGDGAAIAMMGAPEEALFVSLTIRDGILNGNEGRSSALLFARIGINLGPVRVVRDLNSQLSIIGDGINVAQRVMCFAEPNQILVSRSYYEIVSRLSDEFTQMFTYSGMRQDKHVREHELYLIRPSRDHLPLQDIEDEALMEAAPSTALGKARTKKLWLVGGAMAVLVVALLGRSHMTWVEKPVQPAPVLISAATSEKVKPAAAPVLPVNQASTTPSAKTKTTLKSKSHTGAARKTGELKSAESTPASLGSSSKKDSTKLARHEPETCTAAERSLNQCH